MLCRSASPGGDGPLVVILGTARRPADPPLTALLGRARDALAAHHAQRFARAGGRVAVLEARDPPWASAGTFGETLAAIASDRALVRDAGLVVLGAGSVPLLSPGDARRLVSVAASGAPVALTNNRHSSDVCAVGRGDVLRDLPPLPADNALPRWLEERAAVAVAELPGRERLALDLDTPLDLALLARVRGAPEALRTEAAQAAIAIPRLDALRSLAADPRRELLVAGRSGSRTLRWLERSARCRVRFLAEERGLRAASELALRVADGAAAPRPGRPPRTTLGRLLDVHGPDALGRIVADLADGAILDTRVLLADRLGPDEERWPPAEDRYASDLLRVDAIDDPWLRELTGAAARAPVPILLGSHTLVGPGIRWLLG